jgi:hypothetical protein
MKGAHFKGSNVHVLHGIDSEIKSSDILWNWDVVQGAKENSLLPIGHDSFCNMFALDLLAGDDYGKVYYFNRQEQPPRQYDIADDFNSFLAQIRDWTPEELAELAELSQGEPQAFQGTSFTEFGRKVTNEDLDRIESIVSGMPAFWSNANTSGSVNPKHVLNSEASSEKTPRLLSPEKMLSRATRKMPVMTARSRCWLSFNPAS